MPQEITLSRIEVLTKLLNPPHGGDWVLAIDPETLNAQIIARIKGYVSDILGHEDLFPLAMAVERPDGILEGGDWTVVETPSIREHDGLYRSYKIIWLDIGKENYLKKSIDFIHMASQDYEAAQSSDLQYVICFFSQQASEKYLKAYLAFYEHQVPKTHDIGLLLSTCAKIDPSFSSLASYASIFEPYGVEIRYTSDKERAKQDCERVWEALNSIAHFLSKKLPREFTYAHIAHSS